MQCNKSTADGHYSSDFGKLNAHQKINLTGFKNYDKNEAYKIIINNKELTIEELSKNARKLDISEIGKESKDFIEHFSS